jgi:hypothetical protein
LFELCELMETNQSRIYRTFIFTTEINHKKMHSVAAAFHSVGDSKFMPIYICREGIPESSKRIEIFLKAAKNLGSNPVEVEIKPAKTFAERELYFHYLTGVLRLNRLLPEMK